MGKLRPSKGQPQYSMFARSMYGGDCAAIEHYVLALLNRIAGVKLSKNMQFRHLELLKSYRMLMILVTFPAGTAQDERL